MKEISNREVKLVYLAHGKAKTISGFKKIKEELKLIPEEKWGEQITSYRETWEEFFTDKVKWYKIFIDPKEHFLVNNIFNSLCGTKQRLGVNFEQMVKEYKEKILPPSDIKKIDKIRTNLFEYPRIIIISNSWDKLSIFDGWHRAIAFYVENRKIPSYVGIAKDFTALRIK